MAQIKRNRVEKPEKPRKKQKPSKASLGISKGALKAVAIDALPWKEVALPERLEDAEGFFGLEEIEHVKIIRDDTGNIQYRVGKIHALF